VKSFSLVVLSATLFQGIAFAASPVLPGLSGKHPLSEAEVGTVLINEMRCAACHKSSKSASLPERLAPSLLDVGSRISPEYLQSFIASPSQAHPGSTMPDMLSKETPEQKAKIAQSISHFLIAQSTKPTESQPVAATEKKLGQELFHTVGCVTCHSPRDIAGKETVKEGVVDLGHVKAKYSQSSLSEFLFQPTKVRPSGRMPDMKLTPVEAKAVASYLLADAGKKSVPFQLDPKLTALGKENFQKLNCASCHNVGDLQPAPLLPELEKSRLSEGCLSQSSEKAPRFNFDDSQIKAIRAALTAKQEPLSDKSRLALTLTAFNCIGCHARDKFGGVSEELSPYFTASEKELGDDGRIPPPLTLVGAKLLKVTMKKVLFDGDSVRPHMATRMPQFGEPNLHYLPELFANLDKVKPVELNIPKAETNNPKERERERELRAAGRELIGDKGLNCIACHSFNSKVPNKHGIDLMTTTQRLQPSWVYHFLQDPNAFRPRIVMPTSWPKGEAMHKGILKGDTHTQLEAIWYYLSLGTSAQDPSGIRNLDTALSVAEETRTYRGRSSVAGYRGIAVGFPEKWNYAFNAETGTLSAIWKGDFIRVNRSGQGSGSFNPASRSIQLAQDLSFFALPDEKLAWPLRPIMTKEAPANTDPLYPKNLGYQFKGYHLDDSSIPTFLYMSGNIGIEDRSVPRVTGKNSQLQRTFIFDTPTPQTVWFRALTGKIEEVSKTQYRVGELRLTIPDVPKMLRQTPDQKNVELLLKFELPKGSSTQRLIYEIAP
jgi:mono/diheme cytochrome c family protein/cytochrome c2